MLDGELVVLRDGVPDFFELQRRTLLTDRFKIELTAAKHPASFVAYDCLYKGSHSIILGKYHNGSYLYKGHVTLGVTKAAISQLRESNIIPFTAVPAGAGNENAVWVYPDQVCTAEYMPNTKNSLRQAVFKGFRTDMVPEDID